MSPKLFLLFIPYVLFLIWRQTAISCLVCVVIVASVCTWRAYDVQRQTDTLPKLMSLTFEDNIRINGKMLRGFARSAEGRIYVTYELKSETEKRQFEQHPLAGMTVLAQGEHEQLEKPLHRFQFSMENYLLSQQAIGTYAIKTMAFQQYEQTLTAKLARYRHALLTHIDTHFPKNLRAEAKALLLGDQQDIDHDISRVYQILGITHLFAISGLHVALLGGLFYQLLLICHVRVHWARLLLIVALPTYAIIAGSTPSVWRAATMTLIVLIVQFKQTKISAADALSLSFLLFVLYRPAVIFQVGFQLSYLATAALIYSTRILTTSNWLKNAFFMTFVCQLLVYPLLLHHFYEISLSSFIVNILLVPLFSLIILPMNVILFIGSYIFPTFMQAVMALYAPCRESLTTILLAIADIPYQLWQPGRPDVWLSCIAMLGVLMMFIFFERRHYKRAFLAVALPVCLIQWLPMLHDDLRITYLSVGQGDSTIIELPYRRGVYVVDTGGVLRFQEEGWKKRDQLYEVGRQVVVPYLKGRGLSEIDTLILTHADADHVEGAEEVMKEIRVREIHISPQSATEKVMNDVMAEAKKQHIPVKEQMAGRAFQVGDVSFQYLWPYDIDYEGNNDSLVVKVSRGYFSTLLTGDIEQQGELALLEKSDVRTTILSPGHHGSKTSSAEAFLKATNAQLAIFSTGKNNRYGHPAPEVRERFESLGIPTLNTAEDGTVEVYVGKEIKLKKHQ